MTEKPLIGIIGGKGKMGKLFAHFFEERGFKVIISDKGTKLTNIELAKKADIVIVSVPIPITLAVIKEVAPHVRRDALLTDFTSIKADPVKMMLKNSNCEVVGLHPMFGNSNPIPGQRVIMCPGRGRKWFNWLKRLFEENSVIIEVMPPEKHDEMMTLVQGLVHFSDISFAQTLRDLKIPPEKFLKFASPASEVKISFAARLLDQDPELYGAIQIYNRKNLSTLKKYLKNIQSLIAINEKMDLQGFEKQFLKTAKFLKNYKKRAFQETTWIIDKVLENRRKHALATGATIPKKQILKGKTIATLGPRNTYSDLAAQKIVDSKNDAILYCRSIEEVFEAVKKGTVKKGIVPIENRLNGTIRETLDGLLDSNLQIARELSLPIHHCLARVKNDASLVKIPPNNLKKIIAISSHPQALAQCIKFIKKHCPHAELKGMSSTASAMEFVQKEKDQRLVAIGSEFAAKNLGLEILEKNIEDNHKNETVFFVIQKKAEPKDPNTTYKTSILFYFRRNQPGILLKVLDDLAGYNIDLTRIESRPSREILGNYVFYVDFKGHRDDPNVQKALKTIGKKVAKMKILGSYRVHTEE